MQINERIKIWNGKSLFSTKWGKLDFICLLGYKNLNIDKIRNHLRIELLQSVSQREELRRRQQDRVQRLDHQSRELQVALLLKVRVNFINSFTCVKWMSNNPSNHIQGVDNPPNGNPLTDNMTNNNLPKVFSISNLI